MNNSEKVQFLFSLSETEKGQYVNFLNLSGILKWERIIHDWSTTYKVNIQLSLYFYIMCQSIPNLTTPRANPWGIF